MRQILPPFFNFDSFFLWGTAPYNKDIPSCKPSVCHELYFIFFVFFKSLLLSFSGKRFGRKLISGLICVQQNELCKARGMAEKKKDCPIHNKPWNMGLNSNNLSQRHTNEHLQDRQTSFDFFFSSTLSGTIFSLDRRISFLSIFRRNFTN